MSEVVDAPDTFPILEDYKDAQAILVQLAQYARSLEEKVEAGADGGSGGGPVPVAPRQCHAKSLRWPRSMATKSEQPHARSRCVTDRDADL